MRECRTSGSVGGRRGDPPVYPTAPRGEPDLPPRHRPASPLADWRESWTAEKRVKAQRTAMTEQLRLLAEV
jgi:hypothetical protein